MRIFYFLSSLAISSGALETFESFDDFRSKFFDSSGKAKINVMAGFCSKSCENQLSDLRLLQAIRSVVGGDVLFSAIVRDDEAKNIYNFTECAQVIFYPVDSNIDSPEHVTAALQPQPFQEWVNSVISTPLDIYNDFDYDIDLHWADQHGESFSKGVIEPKSYVFQRSVLGHIFLGYRNLDGHLVDFFVVNGRNYHMSPHNQMRNSHMLECLDMKERLRAFTASKWEEGRGASAEPVSSVVTNQFPYQVELFWTNEVNDGVPQSVLESGDGVNLSARAGHTFYAKRTSDGTIVDFFAATSEPYFLKPTNTLENCDADKIFAHDVKSKASEFTSSIWEQMRSTFNEYYSQLEEKNRQAPIETVIQDPFVANELSDAQAGLIAGVQSGDAALVRRALQTGADVHFRDSNGWTPLLTAADNGHSDVIKVLVSGGAQVTDRFKNGWTAVMIASEKGFPEAVQVLLDIGATVDDVDETGFSALMLASRAGHLEVVSVLLERGASIDRVGQTGWSVLSLAAAHGEREVVSLLLEKGADVNVQDTVGVSALMAAARSGHADLAAVLLEKGADALLVDRLGYSALTIAAQNGHLNVASALIRHGVDIDHEYSNGLTALMLAAKSGQFSLLQALLDLGAAVDKQNKDGKSALLFAVEGLHSGEVTLLLERGASLTLADADGVSALMAASTNGDAEIAALLLNKDAPVNLQANNGYTALMLAAEKGHEGIVSLLLDKKADANLKNKQGKNALQMAETGSNKAIIDALKSKTTKNKFFLF